MKEKNVLSLLEHQLIKNQSTFHMLKTFHMQRKHDGRIHLVFDQVELSIKFIQAQNTISNVNKTKVFFRAQKSNNMQRFYHNDYDNYCSCNFNTD